MGDLTLKKILRDEKGYLLIESLIGLTILSILILVLYPLLVDWILLVEAEKEQVEIARVMYELSFDWPNGSERIGYTTQQNQKALILTDEKNTMDVSIYEFHFER